VTLVGNDNGGALVQLLICDGAARVARVVLVSCDAFDNFPPGLTGKMLLLTGKLPLPMFGLFMQQMRLRPLRRLPIAFGWLTLRGDAATARWMRPVMRQPEIRRDAVRTLRAAAADGTGGLALAMAVDSRMLAPVLSQPSTPPPIIAAHRRDLGLDAASLARVKQRCAEEGAVEIDSSPGNPYGFTARSHGVLTAHFLDQPGSPTRDAALDRVLDFLLPGS